MTGAPQLHAQTLNSRFPSATRRGGQGESVGGLITLVWCGDGSARAMVRHHGQSLRRRQNCAHPRRVLCPPLAPTPSTGAGEPDDGLQLQMPTRFYGGGRHPPTMYASHTRTRNPNSYGQGRVRPCAFIVPPRSPAREGEGLRTIRSSFRWAHARCGRVCCAQDLAWWRHRQYHDEASIQLEKKNKRTYRSCDGWCRGLVEPLSGTCVLSSFLFLVFYYIYIYIKSKFK
jgi:hypothetical protein